MSKAAFTERDMLLTVASMALNVDDLTGHDIIESMKALGYGNVVAEAREKSKTKRKKKK